MKRLIYAAAFLATLASCSKEQDLVPSIELTDGSETVLATAKDFVADGATRTAITQSGSNPPAFAWKEGDVIGIIPMNNETVQSNYKISEIGSNFKNATFDGGVWALKEGKEYAAYYPFKKEAVISGESIGFSFLGQTQTANNSLEHLGDYDYMYASAVVPQSGSAQFDFEHKVSLVRLQLTVPADTYSKVVLESSASWFASKASLKLSDGTMAATEAVKSATINLDDIEISANGVLTVWFAALPTTALNGQALSVKLFGAEGYAVGEIAVHSEWISGKAYSYTGTLSSVTPGEAVDLGLPSGVKWASCNLGATTPEEYGDYYAWGATETWYEAGYAQEDPQNHWKSGKSDGYNYANCPYHTVSDWASGWTKYISTSRPSYWSGTGNPDNKTVLDLADDAAHVNLGGGWRMPTVAEWEELTDTNNCTWKKTSQNEVFGFKITSRITGNSIFLPAASFRYGVGLMSGVSGAYWSSSLNTDEPFCAWILTFTEYQSHSSVRSIGGRGAQGRSVRPVYQPDDYVPVIGVSLNRSSLSLNVGDNVKLVATVTPSNATNKSVRWQSSDSLVVSMDGGIVTARAAGTAMIYVYTDNGGKCAVCTVDVVDCLQPEAVDLGLPSGLKWASCNLGATKPEEYGGYYQWAGLQDVTSTSIQLDWSNCPYHTGSSSSTGWTKYVPSNRSSYWSGSGSPDNKTVLDPEDDIAHVALGGKWRMPTIGEFQELIINCTSEWTTLNGINGQKFTSDKNGNSIFLPAAVYRYDEYRGIYWSSSLDTDDPEYACELFFNSDLVGTYYRNYRYDGLSVRPVIE